jgi:deoxyribodipyrimidine photo-lyase
MPSSNAPTSDINELRIRSMNDSPINPGGAYVLYWMIANRRVHWNYSLQRAADWAKHLGKPLLIFEPLRCKYHWASDRIHWFVIQGMADNAKSLAKHAVTYYPYL